MSEPAPSPDFDPNLDDDTLIAQGFLMCTECGRTGSWQGNRPCHRCGEDQADDDYMKEGWDPS